jgi:tRNA A-37 threonylcarbamoyl transferase component Bud32
MSSSKGKNLLSCFDQRRIFSEEKELLKKYLELIYDDLIKKENGKELTKLIFCSYLKFPSLVSENLFRVMNKSGGKVISLEDFVTGLSNLLTDDLEKIKKTIFLISDFEGKGEVCLQDLKLILRFLDSYSSSDLLNDRLEKQFDNLFAKSDFFFLTRLVEINFNSIINNNEKFLRKVIESLNHGIPLTTNSILILGFDNAMNETKHTFDVLDNISINSGSFSENLCHKFRENSKENLSDQIILTSKFKENESHHQLETEGENIETDDEENHNIILPCLKSTRKLINIVSPCKNLKNESSQVEFTISQISENLNFEKNDLILEKRSKTSNPNSKLHKSRKKDIFKSDFEGYAYSKKENNLIYKIWVNIINKDIFIFNSEKEKLLNIIHISTSYAELGNIEIIGQKTFFSFILNFKNSILTFYCKTLQDTQTWVDQTNKAAEYRDIYDYYDFDKVIGKGHFGEVRLGYSKVFKTKVAIKVIYKKNLKPDELEATLAEAEILKICRHKNIVHLIDTFDTSDVLYIVLEYLENGTLNQFLKKNRKILSYQNIKKITKDIAEGINYLHSNGIIHRDLKPENIMFSENLELKIVDLGMSKIVGRENKIHQRLGTLTYMAPEVFQGKGYNKEADMWSLGMILFFLLSGRYAFENCVYAKSFLRRPNIQNETFFSELTLCNVSQNAIDLVKKCLCEQYKRININQFLQHCWFEKK